ncbi:M64 family metallopeptidase [Methanolobus sp. ZRKC3]|uniref:M64 family metallopeptidase n=1 Tax=Methanolobus sp. ZRKC3 TaxID=3125786 RepID=UPI00324B7F9D
MGTSDGTVVGPTKILNNGPDSDRFNIVFLAEGFQDTEQTAFNNACDDFVDAIQLEPWFDTLISAINIHRINVESDDSGADDPGICGGTGATANTYFDATYCGDGVIRRLLVCDGDIARGVLDTHVPDWDVAVVLVNNSTIRGGSGGGIATVAMTASWINITLHELGHSAFALADEYDYWAGCGVDTNRDVAPSGEPSALNVTAATTRSALKWGHLVDSLTPVPTMENPDCTQCDWHPNVLSDDTIIGLYEGAQYYHCGRYRPAYICRMRNSNRHFCRVCVEAIHDILRPFFGASPTLAAELSTLDFDSLGQGGVVTMKFQISNVGTVDVTGVSLSVDNSNYSASLLGTGTTLTPGESRDVEVTLGPVWLNGPQNSTLQITSNAPALNIMLIGSICTAQPQVSIVTQDGGTTLDFGEVSRGLTMYRSVEIRNLRVPCSAPLSVSMTDPTGGFLSAPGTLLNFTLPTPNPDEVYTSRKIYVAFTAPNTGPTDYNGQFTINTPDDSVNPSTDIQLTASVIDPPFVDSVLVIDRSGSMADATGEASQRKIDHAIYAAELYVSLLKDNDRIGLVRYNHHSSDAHGDRLLDPVVAGPVGSGAGRVAALSELNLTNLHPSGSTSVGAGIILGSDVLDSAAADSRALVVLTDGRQNTDPDIPAGIAHVATKTPSQRVFAVGLGLNQLEDKLNEIATVTNGTAQITGDLVGEKEFILQKLFVQILSDVADEAFIKDPRRILPPQGKQYTDIMIGEVDVAADFILAFRPSDIHPKYLRVWLEAPNGKIITPSDIAGGGVPNVSFSIQRSHMFFRLLFPAFPEEPTAHVGRWRMWVENFIQMGGDVYTAEYGRSLSSYYSVMAKARSNLLLKGRLVQTSYLPGSEMEVILEPVLFGQPVTLDEPVEVSFRRPDGVKRTIKLSRDENGAYHGIFKDTSLYGPYQAAVEASASSPQGIRLTRYRHFTGIILSLGQVKDGKDFGKECCEDLKHLLIEILKTLKYCCEKKDDFPKLKLLSEVELLKEIESRLVKKDGDREQT